MDSENEPAWVAKQIEKEQAAKEVPKHGCANCGSTDFIVATDLSGRPFPGQLCDKCSPVPSWRKGPPTMPGRWFVYVYGWYLVEHDADGTIIDCLDEKSVIPKYEIYKSYGPIPMK